MFVNLLPKESVGSVFRVLCVMGCLTPAVAQAGFDWTPPAPSVVPPPVPAAQAPVVPSGPLTPEPDALTVPVGSVEAEAAPLTPAPSKPAVQVPAVPARPFVAEDTTTPLVIDNTKQNLSPSAKSVIEPKDDEGQDQKKIADVPSAPDQRTDPAPLVTESASSAGVTRLPEADPAETVASPATTPAVVPTPISLDMQGKVLKTKNYSVQVDAEKAVLVDTLDLSRWLRKLSQQQHLIQLRLMQGSQVLHLNLIYFVAPKDLKLPTQPDIAAQLQSTGDHYTIHLRTSALA